MPKKEIVWFYSWVPVVKSINDQNSPADVGSVEVREDTLSDNDLFIVPHLELAKLMKWGTTSAIKVSMPD